MSFRGVFVEQDAGNAARAEARRSIKLRARSRASTPDELVVFIHNISSGGFLLEAAADALAVGDSFSIDLPEGGSAESKVVWNSDRFFGCAFRHPVSKAALSGALLRSEPKFDPGLPTRTMAGAGAASLHIDGPAVFTAESNFAAALALALGLWLLIGVSAYSVLN